jgi:hypothetical protein
MAWIADNDLVQKRVKICKVCPELSTGVIKVCSACGCPIKSKILIKKSTCPLKKWEQ